MNEQTGEIYRELAKVAARLDKEISVLYMMVIGLAVLGVALGFVLLKVLTG